ncbi:MAG: polyhydroxyalkanoate synthesis repressor PhaR [Acidobacteriota bacterium]|nr:polyhydroxyalkanoate synthesis repressor PhaR [Acidobacteriota bacterium]MDH3529683.1 polyhydroxyalkanoate synthesis repressor PhaR [Acidobacteriota bacterium]
MSAKKASKDVLVIKRYGNRRLYNTETKGYVNYEDLARIVRQGRDIKVVDSKSKEDVTKSVLIQMILEEEKNDQSVLPTDFLFQVLRSRNDSMQDFFRNHLSASFEAYMKTKEQFDNQFRSVLEMAFSAPKTIEKLIPGAEVVREVILGKDDEKEENKDDE